MYHSNDLTVAPACGGAGDTVEHKQTWVFLHTAHRLLKTGLYQRKHKINVEVITAGMSWRKNSEYSEHVCRRLNPVQTLTSGSSLWTFHFQCFWLTHPGPPSLSLSSLFRWRWHSELILKKLMIDGEICCAGRTATQVEMTLGWAVGRGKWEWDFEDILYMLCCA